MFLWLINHLVQNGKNRDDMNVVIIISSKEGWISNLFRPNCIILSFIIFFNYFFMNVYVFSLINLT